jgi:hypothetical protein
VALPTPAKTWTIDPCNRETCTTLLEAVGDCLLGIKNALKLGSGVTVKGSCNATTGTMDGTDRWTTTTDVQTGFNGTAGAQAWIVLKFANMGGAELLFTANRASTTSYSFYFSPGGNYALAATATHKPTASDEVTIGASTGLMSASATNDRLWSSWIASDGSALFWGIAEAGVWTSFLCFQLVQSRCAGGITFSPAVAGFIVGSQAGHNGAFSSWGTARPATRLNPGGGAVNISGFFGSEGYKTGIAGTTMANVAELQGGGHNIYPVSFWSETATARGVVGNWIDLWCGNTSANDGDTYPNDATRTFLQVSDFVVKWDGSAVAMT